MKNFRFWQWINDGYVKLTIKPGQTLRWQNWFRTEEGWGSHSLEFELSGDGAELSLVEIHAGSDCDGRHSETWEMLFDTVGGTWRTATALDYPDYPELQDPDVRMPMMVEKRKYQRDERAEAMGY